MAANLGSADMSLGVGEIVEVRFEGRHVPTLKRWNIVRHWRVFAALSVGATNYEDCVNIANALHVAFGDGPMTLLTEDMTLLATRAKRIAPTESVFGLFTETVVGGALGPVDEFDDAAVVTLYTDQPGRRAMGRIYLPGVVDTTVGDGLIDSVVLQAILATLVPIFAETFTALPGGGELIPVVFSKTTYAETNDVVPSTALISRLTMDQVMRRMTSREIPGRIPVSPPNA
jgi:hypothetical protein